MALLAALLATSVLLWLNLSASKAPPQTLPESLGPPRELYSASKGCLNGVAAPSSPEEPAQATLPAGVPSGLGYLALVEKCPGVALREGQTLVLEYSLGPTLLFVEAEEGGDVKAEPGNARLVVSVSRRGGVYAVNFTLALSGAPLRGGGNMSLVKTLTLLYDGAAYYLPNGTRVGLVFPLFARGRELELSFLWARPGEPYKLESLRPATARMKLLTVLDMERMLVAEVNVSSGEVVLARPLNRPLSQEAELASALAALGGCPRLFALATYSSRALPLHLVVDYASGIPVFALMRGAQRTLPTSKVVWEGRVLDEVPASTLAALLGVRSDLALTLERVQLKD